MKRLLLLVAFCAVLLPCGARAADQGPQRRTTLCTTNDGPKSAITPPVTATGRFDPAWLVLSGFVTGTTQTVSVVSGLYTQTISTVTANGFTALTNLPTLFYGDKLLMTTTGLTTNTVRASLIGRVFN